MKGQNKIQILASFFLIFAIFVFTEIKAESYSGGKDRIIEICSEGIVYVPPGTKIVKCMGKIKKVKKIIPYHTMLREGESCICWKCCDGECGVIISCDAEPERISDSDSNIDGTLCLILLDCD